MRCQGARHGSTRGQRKGRGIGGPVRGTDGKPPVVSLEIRRQSRVCADCSSDLPWRFAVHLRFAVCDRDQDTKPRRDPQAMCVELPQPRRGGGPPALCHPRQWPGLWDSRGGPRLQGCRGGPRAGACSCVLQLLLDLPVAEAQVSGILLCSHPNAIQLPLVNRSCEHVAVLVIEVRFQRGALLVAGPGRGLSMGAQGEGQVLGPFDRLQEHGRGARGDGQWRAPPPHTRTTGQHGEGRGLAMIEQTTWLADNQFLCQGASSAYRSASHQSSMAEGRGHLLDLATQLLVGAADRFLQKPPQAVLALDQAPIRKRGTEVPQQLHRLPF